MVKNIIYVQPDEDIANAIISGITGSHYELFRCKTAGEALSLMVRQDTPLLMLDINIPDMRLHEVVARCSRDFPATVLAIFIDYANPELLAKLVNRHSVYKIFTAPWNTGEIIEHIKDAMDYAEIRAERLMREQILNKSSVDFDKTLSTLTDSLKYQQYSYYKLNTIINTIFMSMLDASGEEALLYMRKEVYCYANDVMVYLMKAQTVGKMEVESFEEIMLKELALFETVKITVMESCLIGDVPRVKLANIRFMIMLVVSYLAKYSNMCEVMILSSYLSKTKVYMEVRASFPEETEAVLSLREKPVMKLMGDIVDRVLKQMTSSVTCELANQTIKYKIEVPLSFMD